MFFIVPLSAGQGLDFKVSSGKPVAFTSNAGLLAKGIVTTNIKCLTIDVTSRDRTQDLLVAKQVI